MLARHLSRSAAGFILVSTLLLSGCMNPGMYYGAPYGRPMYAPPRTLNQAAPGSLHIPESGLPYEPGRTYDDDPDRSDDFERSDDGGFYGSEDDDIPKPRDSSDSLPFDDELGGSTSLEPYRGKSDLRPVSHSQTPVEHGFDTAGYQWLRGSLSYDRSAGGWVVTYSIAANDRYHGQLSLNLTTDQSDRLREGDFVDVHGEVHPTLRDHQGRPVYQVELIRKLTASPSR